MLSSTFDGRSSDALRNVHVARKPYPTGYSWTEFVAKTQTEHRPFALVLERTPEWNEMIFCSQLPREIFFGIMNDSPTEETLGFGCFGRATKYFGQKGEQSVEYKEPTLIVPDRLDPKFLRTSNFEEGETPTFGAPMDHKVISVITDISELDTRLSKFVDQFIPAGEEVVSQETAKRMLALRDRLDLFSDALPAGSRIFPAMRDAKKKLVDKLDDRVEMLLGERRQLRLQIERYSEEI